LDKCCKKDGESYCKESPSNDGVGVDAVEVWDADHGEDEPSGFPKPMEGTPRREEKPLNADACMQAPNLLHNAIGLSGLRYTKGK